MFENRQSIFANIFSDVRHNYLKYSMSLGLNWLKIKFDKIVFLSLQTHNSLFPLLIKLEDYQ